ncbi:MAG: DNA polymerase III subunit alpha, partial [Gammaproteobacteria bacterium]
MQSTFIHLSVHSEYSLVDGLITVDSLVNAVANIEMPAVALTEQSNLFSIVKFYKAALKNGVKPIIGIEIRIIKDTEDRNFSRLILLCQNIDGYKNLTRLITRSHIDLQSKGENYIPKYWLKEYSDNLIALSGGRDGDIGQAILSGNQERALSLLDEWKAIFPDRFYMELQRINRSGEEEYLHAAIDLAAQSDVPVVASNDVRFLKTEDYEAHEARVCIQQGYTLNDPRRPHLYTQQQYLRDPQEMQVLFSDIPEAIENTWLIAQRCNLELTLGENYLPHFPVPKHYNQDDWLRNQARDGLQERILLLKEEDQETVNKKYQQRLETELDVIIEMGFAGYFLIVADFIQWAKDNVIPVGPGRGSGAGSLVAYSLGITELDPLQYDLLFERFLNPERVSLPDFDIDFCMDRRDEVIDYVSQRYGSDHVSQIITFGSMAAKAVVRDVGRVLGYPYGFVDQIAKLIPFDPDMTLERAMEEDDTLKQRYKKEDDVNTLINLALKLEGLCRNAGRHAGGIVIAPERLTDYMPLYCEQGTGSTVTQFDMGDVEAIGLVKFDFLGLRTLTIIDWAISDINQGHSKDNEPVNISDIPLDDKPTYELIRRTDTTAVFQLESDGMKKLIKRLQPDGFDELIALVALFRPGPLQSGMVDNYVERKHGKASIQHLHPKLEHILKPTYGVILYQEQVMQIAQILAGYTLGAADLLRRAMGKKKPEEMAKQREIFIKGAIQNGVKVTTASHIFDLMEKFAGYGFNKSHSAAYALIAYQTAWLKAHYPATFMAAVLSSDMDNTDKVVTLLEELRKMKITLEPPAINHSVYSFTATDSKTIRYGLGAIKGVGEAAIDNILKDRDMHGSFTDIFDLCSRIDLRKANRRVLDALIKSGVVDEFGPGRSSLIKNLDKAIQFADQYNENSHSGQNDLFGLGKNNDDSGNILGDVSFSEFVTVPDWSEEERLAGEKETLGFYLKGHPIIRYEEEFQSLVTTKLKDIKPGKFTVAG